MEGGGGCAYWLAEGVERDFKEVRVGLQWINGPTREQLYY